jgi:hypothetical protein
MTYEDTQIALLKAIYAELSQDATLITLMGSKPRIYHGHAKANAEMPYIVHKIEMSSIGDPFPIRQGAYIVNIWSSSQKADEALNIRKRVIELLDELNLEVDSGEAIATRIWLQTEGFVDDDVMYHYALQFNIRYYRAAEVYSIITRVES